MSGPDGGRGPRVRHRGTLSAAIASSALIAGLTCTAEPSPGPRPTVAEPTTSPTRPATDVTFRRIPVTSRDEVATALRRLGWDEALVPTVGTVVHVDLWRSGGHWHAQTTYDLAGLTLDVTQAEGEGLPVGDLVLVRGRDGVRSSGAVYWLERGWVLAVSVTRKDVIARLEWLELR